MWGSPSSRTIKTPSKNTVAIVIEEQKNQTGNAVNIVLWLGFVALVAGAVYFLIFAAPELVSYIPPTGFTVTGDVAGVSLDPRTVLDDPQFKELRAYITIPESTDFGRANPFLTVSGASAGLPVPRR